jgi:very-short-patch-repair endonuclease
MNVFEVRKTLVSDYRKYVQSFVEVVDPRIGDKVAAHFEEGELWPEPLLQLNPSFEPGGSIDDLVDAGILHQACRTIFRAGKNTSDHSGRTMRLHRHQDKAIRTARKGVSYVLTTGTGSGKSLAYIIPIIDHVLRNGTGKGIQAIVVYPMNALANSQMGELEKFVSPGGGEGAISFKRYTGQESAEERDKLLDNPPDILLTNYVMLELILTRWKDRRLIDRSRSLSFLVLDELHTYRGRQGADVAMLVRRVREAFGATDLRCVGTSATMAGPGTLAAQKVEVARAASKLFGSTVEPEDVIGETLRRSTEDRDFSDNAMRQGLVDSIKDYSEPKNLEAFYSHPLSSWIETAYGLELEAESGLFKRRKPRAIGGESGAARELADLTGIAQDRCIEVIRLHLLAGYKLEDQAKNNQPPFAFRIHQFLSRGDSVYATIESKDERYITLKGQRFVPGDRSRLLFPLVFCRECGSEYYVVKIVGHGPERHVERRELSEVPTEQARRENPDVEPGFLAVGLDASWLDNETELLGGLPDDFLGTNRQGETVVTAQGRKVLPQKIHVTHTGSVGSGGESCLYIPAPFRFCPCCGVAYSARTSGDFAKLTTLGTEGRSSVITLLSLSMVRILKADDSLPSDAKKLLSFTDNRQDAALQAGHFNDFVQVGLLRSALYRAVALAGPEGLRYDQVVPEVFKALKLPFAEYAKEPDLTGQLAIGDTNAALREVIGYRIYRDLERGWRILLPNLEQCGLLRIDYVGLSEFCANEKAWAKCHEVLVAASPGTREKIIRVLLDIMRRGLAIKVDYLEQERQEAIKSHCRQHLLEEDATAWTLGDGENLYTASMLWPVSKSKVDSTAEKDSIFLSGLSGFGQYLRRVNTFPDLGATLKVDDASTIIQDLLEALRKEGIVETAAQRGGANPATAYRLKAAAMIWKAGDGKVPHDPVRMPRRPDKGLRINPFFKDFYRETGGTLQGYEAREHTAQVKAEIREEREKRFGNASLPVLYASATLELGVDIKDLNAVNMRNIPPTPANYAQRSGRAGRNGQPAIVFSYCSTYRSHDQYFFRRPLLMVAGAVSTPRIDLSNEDLVASHVHSLWLSASGVDLRFSMTDVIDTADLEALPIHDSIADQLKNPALGAIAKRRVQAAFSGFEEELAEAPWWQPDWIDTTLANAFNAFNQACDRWRTLYRTARRQAELHFKIINDHARSFDDKKRSKSLRAEAEAQSELLASSDGRADSDFYTYRYFASEGFLPGYNFPRLPLSAYIPGKKPGGFAKPDQFLSRPRFLAVSEFGPRSIVYHDGSRYRIERVIMETNDNLAAQSSIAVSRAKICPACGYLHVESETSLPDVCEWCGKPLSELRKNLFRMQNVSTRRLDRINSDEEERSRIGYDIVTSVRFSEQGGRPRCTTATVEYQGKSLAKLSYGPAALIWRLNTGWKRRVAGNPDGFLLDIERGYWAKNQADDTDNDSNPASLRTERVVPYVEDRRNCLIIQPEMQVDLDDEDAKTAWMASFESALKSAIREEYQLGDSELASEPLPNAQQRDLILIYEASEGGAGVLRQLVEDPSALQRVGRSALEICHYNPDTAEDSGGPAGSKEGCEAACYDCLMSYSNQQDHERLDRTLVKDWFFLLSRATTESTPGPKPKGDHLAELLASCDSELEKKWLRFLGERGYNLPSRSQVLIPECGTRPDFVYDEHDTVVYVDGPIHDYPDRAKRDREQEAALENAGKWVVRFGHDDDWEKIIKAKPSIFGGGRP